MPVPKDAIFGGRNPELKLALEFTELMVPPVYGGRIADLAPDFPDFSCTNLSKGTGVAKRLSCAERIAMFEGKNCSGMQVPQCSAEMETA